MLSVRNKLAKLISIAFGPEVLLPALLVIIVFKSGLTFKQMEIVIPAVLVFQFLVPAIYILMMLKLKETSSWDLPRRQDRYRFLLVTVASFMVSLALIYQFGNRFLLELNLILTILALIFFTVTFFWKISLHSGIATTVSILANFLFDWKIPALYLMIPLVWWSRYALGRHTLAQLLAGACLCAAVSLGFLTLFGSFSFI